MVLLEITSLKLRIIAISLLLCQGLIDLSILRIHNKVQEKNITNSEYERISIYLITNNLSKLILLIVFQKKQKKMNCQQIQLKPVSDKPILIL